MFVDYEISYYNINFLKMFSLKMVPERRFETWLYIDYQLDAPIIIYS